MSEESDAEQRANGAEAMISELARQDAHITDLEVALAALARTLVDAERRAEAAEQRAVALRRVYCNAGMQVREEMKWRQVAIVRAEEAEVALVQVCAELAGLYEALDQQELSALRAVAEAGRRRGHG